MLIRKINDEVNHIGRIERFLNATLLRIRGTAASRSLEITLI